MSTILDALRKLERDKELDAAQDRPADPLAPPAVPQSAPAAGPGSGGRSRGAPWLVGAAVLTFAVGIGFGLWSNDDHVASRPDEAGSPLARTIDPARSQPARSDAAQAARSARSDAVSYEPIPGVVVSMPESDAVGSMDAPTPGAGVSSAPPAGQDAPIASPRDTQAPPASTARAATGANARRTPATRAVKPEPAPAPAPSRSALAGSTSAPLVADEMSSDADSAHPALGEVVVEDASGRREVSVVKTVWHPNADRRSARIRLAPDAAPIEVREGEVVQGYRVETITPSTVVLEKDGVTATHRVGG